MVTIAVATSVYIDGFNLYYGAIKGTAYRWLNIAKFCQFMLPGHFVNRICYCTALVSARPGDPGQPVRQQTFLRALATLPNVEIIYGHFLQNEATALLAHPCPGGARTVAIIKTEEKGSDVNLATHLLCGAFRGDYDCAVIISNDSDLYEPIRIAKQEFGKRIIIINPHKSRPSRQLRSIADEFKTIREGTLRVCQFPQSLTDGKGTFHKPATW